ncbi:aminodeoxychorismate synthase component I [Pirellulaceae bacterium SH449]
MTDTLRKPLFQQLDPAITPEAVFHGLKGRPYCCWLDSALKGGGRGRYSFVCADPVEVFELNHPVADPLSKVQGWLDLFPALTVEGCPPFQGGVAGYLGYEFGRCIERIPSAEHDEFSTPLAVLGLYDVVFAWDHEQDTGWVFSHGFTREQGKSDLGEGAWQERAAGRLEQFMSWVDTRISPEPEQTRPNWHAMAHGLTAEQFETRLGGGWLGNFDSQGYQTAVQKARDYIFAGDIFQVNLSQRLLCPARCESTELYTKLRQVNAAPFAGYFDFGSGQIISASPERFFHVRDRWIETRPIKGTRRRTGCAEEDAVTANELLNSEKDRSENVMIVDLLRNDLSRVCDPDSMRVEQLCQIEEYPFVLHLVSVIGARLRRDVQWADVMQAVFPGGSITGAPKVRAMEIIAELEPTVRGPYCGSLGYVGTDGSMDWNILIRTLTASRGWWQFQVGGGIVADSQPLSEEEETWTKAAGLVAAIEHGSAPSLQPANAER